MRTATNPGGWRGWLLALAILALGAAPATAEDSDVQVCVIRASKSGDKVSSEIRSLAEQLKKKYGYTSAILEKTLRGKATDSKPFESDVVGPYKVKVRCKERKGDRITVQVTVVRAAENKPDDDKGKNSDNKRPRGKRERDKGKDDKNKEKDKGGDEEVVANVTMTIDQGKTVPIEGLSYPGGASGDVLVLAISAK